MSQFVDLSAPTIDLRITKNDNTVLAQSIADEDENPIDITGYSFKILFFSTSNFSEKIHEKEMTITNATAGEYEMKFEAADWSAIGADYKIFYKIEMTEPDTDSVAIQRGKIEILN